MNKHIKQFLSDIEQRQERPVKRLARERDAKLAELEKLKVPHRKQLLKAQTELTAARAWLENIPWDAEPGDIAAQQVIVDKWPDRIAKFSEAVAELELEARDVRQTFTYGARHCQTEARYELQQAVRDLQVAEPNVYKFA